MALSEPADQQLQKQSVRPESKLRTLPNREPSLAWAVLASMLLHVGLLVLFSKHNAIRSVDSTAMVFELVTIAPELPEPIEAPKRPQTASAPVDQSRVELTPSESTPELIPELISDLDDEPNPATAIRINPAELRQQLRTTLDITSEITSEIASDRSESSESNASIITSAPVDVPGMPQPAGWLNNYVGTVETSVERWSDPGGAVNSKTVLSTGQVICTQGASPAWDGPFSIGWPPVAMSRICGRVRPTPVDTSNIEHRGILKPARFEE